MSGRIGLSVLISLVIGLALAAGIGAVIIAGTFQAPLASPTSAPQTVSTSATPTPSVIPGTCESRDLALGVHATDAGAGSQFFELTLTNNGASSCQLAGFPGLSLVDDSGQQVGPDARQEAGSDHPVVALPLAGAAVAAFRLPNPANFDSGACGDTSAALRVYPPGNSTPLTVPFSGRACPGWSVQAVDTP